MNKINEYIKLNLEWINWSYRKIQMFTGQALRKFKSNRLSVLKEKKGYTELFFEELDLAIIAYNIIFKELKNKKEKTKYAVEIAKIAYFQKYFEWRLREVKVQLIKWYEILKSETDIKRLQKAITDLQEEINKVMIL